MTTGATEVSVGAVTEGAMVLPATDELPCDCTWPSWAALVLLTFVLAISGDGASPANAYPEAIPSTAVAESPVTKILADLAGFFAVRLFVIVDFVGELVGGGGGGRSGSFIISRRPHLRGGRPRVRRALRALRGHRHHHGEGVMGLNPLMDCLH